MMVKTVIAFCFSVMASIFIPARVFAQAPAAGTATFKYQTGLQTNSPSAYADFVPASTLGQDGGYGYEFITQGTGTTSSYYTQVSFYVFNTANNDGMVSFDRNSTNVTINAAFIRSARTGAATTQGLTAKPVAGGPFRMYSIDLLAISGTPTVSVQAYNDGVAVGSPQTGAINTTTKTTFNFSTNANFYDIDEIGITGFNADGIRADNLVSTTAIVNTGAPVFSYTTPQVYTSGTIITPLGPTNTGGLVGAFGAFATFAAVNTPGGVALDASGNVYVTDTNDIDVFEFSAAGAAVTGSPHNGKATDSPYGVILDGSGNIYVANGPAHTVTIVNSLGLTTDVTGFNDPVGLAVDAANNIYVSDLGNGNIYKIVAGTSTANVILSGFTTPSGIAVNTTGDIYVAQYTLNNIIKVASGSSTKTTFISTGLNTPFGMVFGPLGNLYVADEGSNTIKQITTAGVVNTIKVTSLAYPYDVAFDLSGDVFITDFATNTVQKAVASGYSINAPLPAGLNFNNYTGAISGTPTVITAATVYTITATNLQGSSTATLSITVNIAAPVISYASPQVYTVGTTITALSPTSSGGVVAGYTVNPALPAGLSMAAGTGIITGKPTAATTAANYTVTATNATGTGTAVISIACGLSDSWTAGSSTTAWATAGNWSSGAVPGINDAVAIGVAAYTHAYEPAITAGSVSVSSVTFGAAHAGILTVGTGTTLTISSNLTINTGASPTIKGAGTGAVSIAPGAMVNVTGTGVLTLTSPLNFTLLSSVAGSASIGQVLSTSIVGTAAASINVQRYITGGPGYRGYRLVSSPVYNGTVSPNNVYSINYLQNSVWLTGLANGGFDKTGNPTLYLYREDQVPSNASFTGGNFWGISAINNTPNYNYELNGGTTVYNIPAGSGYMLFFRGNKASATLAAETVPTYTTPVTVTLSTSGTLNTGQIITRDWYTPASAYLGWTNVIANAGPRGFNLVGNPYASSIDWETYNTTTTTTGIYANNVSNTVYELNPATNNYDVYQVGGLFTNHGTRTIVSGQGFFVLAANSTNPQLIFNESAKTATQNNGLNLFMDTRVDLADLNATNIGQYLRLQISLDSLNTDDVYIGFKSNSSTAFVNNEDAPYKSGNGDVHLASFSSDNVMLAINEMPLPGLKQTVIPLFVTANAYGTYKLTMTELQDLPPLYEVWLMDRFNKDSLDIRHNPAYTFDLTADTNSYGSKRFQLVVRQDPALEMSLLNFTAAKSTSGVLVGWTVQNEGDYTGFSVERSTDGGNIYVDLTSFVSGSLGTYSYLDKSLVPATAGTTVKYRLKIEDVNDMICYSNVITFTYANLASTSTGAIEVYPDPVNDIINLVINQQSSSGSVAARQPAVAASITSPAVTDTQALYDIEIINMNGAVLIKAVSSTNTWESNISNLLPGTYILQVTNQNNSMVGKTMFIKL